MESRDSRHLTRRCGVNLSPGAGRRSLPVGLDPARERRTLVNVGSRCGRSQPSESGTPVRNNGFTMSDAPRPVIRRADLSDIAAITDIYNEAILTSTATFDTEPRTVDDRIAWLHSHDDRHPVLVAVIGSEVLGWASLTRWSERPAYDGTAETTFYVAAEYRGRGIGRQLKEAIIAEARRLGFHTLIARMAEGSDASRHVNQSVGFVHVGTLKEVGQKFGRWLDVDVMQLMLD